jgi:hypothetical protein
MWQAYLESPGQKIQHSIFSADVEAAKLWLNIPVSE